MSKFKLNHKGFIITLLDTITGDKISVYADIVSWKDAVSHATSLLSLKRYCNCVLYRITKCILYEQIL